jgi:hypothetical protein
MRPAAELPEASACRIDLPTRERVLAASTAHLAAKALDQSWSLPQGGPHPSEGASGRARSDSIRLL